MKPVILYHSKQGHTKTCMNHIANQLQQEEIYTITNAPSSFETFDTVIIGTPVYMGSINKDIKTFVSKHESVLLEKKVYIIICAMNDSEYEDMLTRNFSATMLDHATVIHPGGGYDFTKLNFLERFIVKKIAKVKHSESNLNLDVLQVVK